MEAGEITDEKNQRTKEPKNPTGNSIDYSACLPGAGLAFGSGACTMSIEFRCSQCGQLLRVPEDAGGKSARCPKCQALMTVPGVASVVSSASDPNLSESSSTPVSPSANDPLVSEIPPARIPPPPSKPAAENPFAAGAAP